jgi:hypothetical protein
MNYGICRRNLRSVIVVGTRASGSSRRRGIGRELGWKGRKEVGEGLAQVVEIVLQKQW